MTKGPPRHAGEMIYQHLIARYSDVSSHAIDPNCLLLPLGPIKTMCWPSLISKLRSVTIDLPWGDSSDTFSKTMASLLDVIICLLIPSQAPYPSFPAPPPTTHPTCTHLPWILVDAIHFDRIQFIIDLINDFQEFPNTSHIPSKHRYLIGLVNDGAE